MPILDPISSNGCPYENRPRYRRLFRIEPYRPDWLGYCGHRLRASNETRSEERASGRSFRAAGRNHTRRACPTCGLRPGGRLATVDLFRFPLAIRQVHRHPLPQLRSNPHAHI